MKLQKVAIRLGANMVLMNTAMSMVLAVIIMASSVCGQEDTTVVDYLSIEAQAMTPLVTSQPAKSFLEAVVDLPTHSEPRIAYVNKAERSMIGEHEYDGITDSARAGYERREYDDEFYYYTRYGTPLAFVRPLDLVCRKGVSSLTGTRIIDFGFGSIGQLRLMASLGARVDGIEADPLLGILYGEPSDTGAIEPSRSAAAESGGSLHIHIGSFPSDTAITNSLGQNYDVFFSKNTLKRGYIHPEREVDLRMLVHLGVEDSVFVTRVYNLLKPGGYFMIYNLHPKRSTPDDEKYIPWSDGRCPFDRGLLERAGFKVLDYDVDDTEFARKMAIALGWDKQMNLETDLFGMYTLVQK